MLRYAELQIPRTTKYLCLRKPQILRKFNTSLHVPIRTKKEVDSKLLNIRTRIFNSFGRLWNMESVVTQYLLILKRPRQHNNNNNRLTAFDPGQPVASDHLHPDLSILIPLPCLRPCI